jgi:hypothetical protein
MSDPQYSEQQSVSKNTQPIGTIQEEEEEVSFSFGCVLRIIFGVLC